MRLSLALVVLSLVVGCTPHIPVRSDFGTSALAPAGETPPEFADFNNYNPGVNALLASQICATGYEPVAQKTLGAAPGTLVEARVRCRPHQPLVGDSRLWPAVE